MVIKLGILRDKSVLTKEQQKKLWFKARTGVSFSLLMIEFNLTYRVLLNELQGMGDLRYSPTTKQYTFLSEREIQIVKMHKNGYCNREIKKFLGGKLEDIEEVIEIDRLAMFDSDAIEYAKLYQQGAPLDVLKLYSKNENETVETIRRKLKALGVFKEEKQNTKLIFKVGYRLNVFDWQSNFLDSAVVLKVGRKFLKARMEHDSNDIHHFYHTGEFIGLAPAVSPKGELVEPNMYSHRFEIISSSLQQNKVWDDED